MSGRCKDCKWWGDELNYDDSQHSCEHPKIDEYRAFEETRATDTMTNSGGEYTTFTGPDFGCVHFEAKQ